MNDVGSDLPPIDVKGLGLLSDVMKWQTRTGGQSSSLESAPENSLQQREDVGKSLETHGKRESDYKEDPKLQEAYQQLFQRQKEVKNLQQRQTQEKYSALLRRDIQSQGALLSPEHPMYSVVATISKRISEAEKRLQNQGRLSRKETSDEFNITISKKDEVNASTFQNGKAVFLESGLISLFDSYLKEVEGIEGIAEDHLAAILGHELSHSDVESEKQYINEEYCDVQGLILTAEAGYNPTASLQLENFLVWFQENVMSATTDGNEKKPIIPNISIPSHPNPQNRRVVIVNALRNKDIIIPNQSKGFTFIQNEIVSSVTQEMHQYMNQVDARILPVSLTDLREQIKSVTSISQLMELMQGHFLLGRAEIARSIAQDDAVMNRYTIAQAIMYEINRRKQKYDHYQLSFDGKPRNQIARDLILRIEDFGRSNDDRDYNAMYAFNTNDLVIGGLAGCLKDDPSSDRQKTIDGIRAELNNDISHIAVDAIHINPQQSDLVKKKSGQFVYSTEGEMRAENDQYANEAKQKEIGVKNDIESIFTYLNGLVTIDAKSILSGDFSTCPELEKKLLAVGVKNFDTYLKEIHHQFAQFTQPTALQQLKTDRATQIFERSLNASKSDTPKTVDEIQYFLEQTKYYRAATFASRSNQIMGGNDFGELCNEKVLELASANCETTEEVSLFRDIVIQREWQSVLDWITLSKNGGSFTTPGLTDVFYELRIAPTKGSSIVEKLLSQNGTNEQSDLLGVCAADSRVKMIGNYLNTVKLMFGEVQYNAGDNYHASYYGLKPRGIREEAKFIAKRKKLDSTYGYETIKDSEMERNMVRLEDVNVDNVKRFEALKEAVNLSGMEPKYMQLLASAEGISNEEKSEYFVNTIKRGKMSIDTMIWSLITVRDNDRTKYSDSFTEQDIQREKRKYAVAMHVLRAFPISPLPGVDVRVTSQIYETLYERKLDLYILDRKVAEHKNGISSLPKAKRPNYKITASVSDHERKQEFKSPYENGAAQRHMDFVLDYIKEGGTVGLSYITENKDELYMPGPYENLFLGPKVNLLGLLKELKYDEIQAKKLSEKIMNDFGDRLTPMERDKWISLNAYIQQPGFVDYTYKVVDSPEKILSEIDVRINGETTALTTYKVDDIMQLFEIVASLPESSYRDYCLDQLYDIVVSIGHPRLKVSSTGLQDSDIYGNHPAKQILEQKLIHAIATLYSPFSFDIAPTYVDLKAEKVLTQTPKSEKYIHDPSAGFYIGRHNATNKLSAIFTSITDEGLQTAFGVKYRNDGKFAGLSPEETTRQIFFDRLRMAQDFPACDFKDAMMLFALDSAKEGVQSHYETLKNDIAFLIPLLAKQVKSPQGKLRIFKDELAIDLGDFSKPVTSETIRKRFETLDTYLEYVKTHLPEKTSGRDTFILQGISAFPFQVHQAEPLYEDLFALDYGTNNREVFAQRAGLEFFRSVKEQEETTSQDVRELVMWLIDKDRQIHSLDEFIIRASQHSVAAQKLIKGFISGIGFPLEKIEVDEDEVGENDGKEFKRKHKRSEYELTNEYYVNQVKVLQHVPVPIKKMMIKSLVSSFVKSSLKNDELKTIAIRAGMPGILTYRFGKGNGLNIGMEDTFNFIVDEGGDETNPLHKEMLFDLLLGEKGPLEEKVERNHENFQERLKAGFPGSQMHGLIDDILDMALQNGNMDRKAKQTAKILAHSFIEASDPVRRASVIFNLLKGFQQIDLHNPDRIELQSKILTIALSSIGVLGAKLGQMDVLIPRQLQAGISSLKHSTLPMSSLTVADIMRQEGMSGDYAIVESVGAASTACAYVIESPQGGRQLAKVVRPEVRVDWRQDFIAVGHMLACMKDAQLIDVETGPVMDQLKQLVGEELKTEREIENVIQYIGAENEKARLGRKGIRAIQVEGSTPLILRTDVQGQPMIRPPDSLIIVEELLDKEQYIELAKITDETVLRRPELEPAMKKIKSGEIYKAIINDFLYRSLELGNWHTDLHDGNIFIRWNQDQQGLIRETPSNDVVYIDFGQTGIAETEEKRTNAARFLTGIALFDRGEVADAIFNAMEDKTKVTPEGIKAELPLSPFTFQDELTKVIAQYGVSEYLTNYLKAIISVLPYLSKLSLKERYDLIAPYMPQTIRESKRTRIFEKMVNATRLFT